MEEAESAATPSSPTSDGKNYRSIIYNAAAEGNVKRIKIFFVNKQNDKSFIDNCLNSGDNNRFPLVIAARNGKADVVEYLLELGADTSVQGVVEFDNDNIQGTPPLWAASAAGNLNIVKLLVEKGKANVNQATNTQSTPLRGACYDGHLDIVNYLLENGADPHIPNRHGHTCLMIAAYRNKIDVVNTLLKTGINVNETTERGNTALHDAAESGNAEIIKILLNHNASLMKDKQAVDPLMGAALAGFKDVVNILADHLHSAIQKRDALKLLGCTLLDKKMDSLNAMRCWKEALEIPLKTHEIRLVREMQAFVPKKEVYENQKEVHSLEDLRELEGNIEAQRMQLQSLVIRERILGGSHTDVHYYLRFRGAVYCDMGQMNRCYDLWKHALELQQENFAPIFFGTITTIQAFQETFTMSLNDYVNNRHQNPNLRVKSSWVKYIFDRVCYELERAEGWNQDRLLEDTDCCGTERCSHLTVHSEYKKLVLSCINLMHILERLNLPSARVEDVSEEKEPKADVARLIKVCKSLHIPILHHTLGDREHTTADLELPKNAVLQQLLDQDLDVNAPDENGDTPMHLVLRATRFRRSLTEALLERGVWVHARNNEGEVIFETMEKLRKSPKANFSGLNPQRLITLSGLACNAMRVKYADKFIGVEEGFPLELRRFYLAH